MIDRGIELSQRIEENCEGDESPRCMAALGVLSFPAAFSDNPRALEPVGLLPYGDALHCTITVSANGAAAAMISHTTYGKADDRSSLAQLGPWIFPGADCLPVTAPLIPERLSPLVPAEGDSVPQLASFGRPVKTRKASAFAPPPSIWPWQIGKALGVLMRAGGGVLELSVQHVARQASLIRTLEERKAEFHGLTYADAADQGAMIAFAAARAALEDPHLFAIGAAAGGENMSALERALIARALFGCHCDPDATPEQALLRGLAGSTHAVSRLAPVTSEIRWLNTLRRPLPTSEGIEIGSAAGIAPVRIKPADRERHLYLLGATGTGKSTLMRSLIRQDMEAGEGVILIDPHGDLSLEVAALVPVERQSDLIFADAADSDGCFVVPLLPRSDDSVELEQAIDCLLRLFMEVLYSGVDGFGPVFEQYFRNALLLLTTADAPERTLVSLPRIFEDEDFRSRLLKQCRDNAVAAFWQKTALKASGEMSLASVTPYVTSKLGRLIGTSEARRIFPGEGRGIAFAEAMDQGKILILRCPKGALGDGLARLAMSACLLKVEAAAMARAQNGTRRPVRLYVDEFQGARGETLSNLLAEGRKFGVTLTLANQSLGQIDGTRDRSLGAAILANVGNLLAFRVGAPDAQKLASWLGRSEAWWHLCDLPDFHMTGRILVDGRPVPLDELLLFGR